MESLTHLSDEDLMTRYQNGQALAFDVLFERHRGKVYGYLIKNLRDEVSAEDVFQMVFLKLHRSRLIYNPEFPFAPWLFMVCRSVLIDAVRKRKNNLEDLFDEPVEPTTETTSHQWAPALNQLTEDQRAAIDMRYSLDYSFEEIAKKLGTSPLNARQLISRSLKKLKSFHTGRK